MLSKALGVISVAKAGKNVEAIVVVLIATDGRKKRRTYFGHTAEVLVRVRVAASIHEWCVTM